MTELEQLVETANHLCDSIDKLLISQKFITDDINITLEHMNFDMLRYANQLKQIKEYMGV